MLYLTFLISKSRGWGIIFHSGDPLHEAISPPEAEPGRRGLKKPHHRQVRKNQSVSGVATRPAAHKGGRMKNMLLMINRAMNLELELKISGDQFSLWDSMRLCQVTPVYSEKEMAAYLIGFTNCLNIFEN
jgi:hypothetical protein